MAFGKNQNQNNEAIHPNSYCGGFAMCAILNDLSENNERNPMNVYNGIMQHQQQLPEPLALLVDKFKSVGKGTIFCLPSSLALFARENRLSAKLKYSEASFTKEEIEAESGRCLEGMTVKTLTDKKAMLEYLMNKDTAYVLLLVNSRHWIAVKYKSNNKGFSVYDPETGERVKLGDKSALVESLKQKYDKVDAIITLKQK